MTPENITAIVTAITSLVVAIGGLVAVLGKLKSAANDRAVATAKVDEIHAAVGAVPSTQPEVKP